MQARDSNSNDTPTEPGNSVSNTDPQQANQTIRIPLSDAVVSIDIHLRIEGASTNRRYKRTTEAVEDKPGSKDALGSKTS